MISGTATCHAESGSLSAHIGTNTYYAYDPRTMGSSTRRVLLLLREAPTATATGSMTVHAGERLNKVNQVTGDGYFEVGATVTASFSLANNILSFFKQKTAYEV